MSGPSSTPICELPGYLSPEPGVDRLFDNVGAVIPGLTTEVLSMVIWNTIEDFYMMSTYRREHIYWRMDPGVLTISFDPYDQDWRVSRFLGFSGLDRVKFEPPGRIRDLTSPPPTTARSGEILLSLKPRSINTTLPYDVWTTYFDVLYNGALARLYMQPAKPYSDMKTGAVYTSMYRRGVASARADAQAAHVREGSSWSYPYFAAGGYPSGRGGGHFPGRW
jgi:hypothetical protein